MLRVCVHQLQPGMILARSIAVPNEQGRTLIGRGCAVTPELGKRLERYGIHEVWVACRALAFLEDVIDFSVVDRMRELYWTIRRHYEVDMSGVAHPLELPKIDAALTALYETLVHAKQGPVLVEKLDSYDNYLASHSTNVCFLAMLMTLKLERYMQQERTIKSSRIKDARELGLGCLVHDYGKLKLPQAIVNKPGPLTSEEMELMKRHTTLGYEMVKGRIPASSAQVVLNHHQRFDGQGYPERVDPKSEQKMPALCGKQIPIFSRIATICDVYDAATTARSYSGAKPPVQALWEIKHRFRGAFDPAVESAFHEIAPAFPIGTCVTLSDGSEAVVVEFHPRHALRPKVQRLRTPQGQDVSRPDLEEIDLALVDDLTIIGCGGVDVRPFMSAEALELVS